MMRAWLSRLAFSFLIIGCALAWQAYKCSTGQIAGATSSQIYLYSIAAVLSICLAITGLGIRHGRRDEPPK